MMLGKQPRLAILLFCATVASHSVVYADGFYTIIGPDGRPMIIPKKDHPQSSVSQKNEAQPVEQQSKQLIVPQKNEEIIQTVATPTKPVEKPSVPVPAALQPIQPEIKKKVDVQEHKVKSIPSTIADTKSVETVTAGVKSPEDKARVNQSPIPASLKVEKSKPQQIVHSVPETGKSNLEAKSSVTIEAKPAPEQAKGFTQVGGVEYVNSEYLEDREFNLEGKKRFYSMPDGTGRFETIERKKGITRSVLDKFMNRSSQVSAPIALAASYVRLSAQDLSTAFENDRCFLDGYSKNKSIKTLDPQKDIGVWPRKPLKDKFEYELVKLDPAIQYIQLDSYASNNEKPVYYWPLVVFLDEQGCVQEGVSGFKNTSIGATLLQHAALQGVIKVPTQARYMMMTPLASAVDVPEQELSDQGQIKIFALQ